MVVVEVDSCKWWKVMVMIDNSQWQKIVVSSG